MSQFYFLLVKLKLPGTREEEESWSDDQEQEDIGGTGEVEYRGSEKGSGRRYMVVAELQPPCYCERKDHEGVCQGVT